MLAITLWHIADWRRAVDALVQIHPDAIQLHADPDTLATHAHDVQRDLSKALGAFRQPKEWWVGIAGDVGQGKSRARLTEIRDLGLRAARDLGAKRVILNCEAAWKKGLPGFQAADAQQFVADARSICSAPVYVTSFDCPGYHSALPWRAFDTGDGWLPQIYAAPLKGSPAPNSKQGRARLRLHQVKWEHAVRNNILKRRPVVGYVQAHHVVARETMWLLDAHDVASMWAFPERCDEQGLRAARAFTSLERLGYRGKGRVSRFQADRGLLVDGLCGERTFNELGL
jgi:hypothetical protein